MPGVAFQKAQRGKAGGWDEVRALKGAGPLGVLSQPLYVPRHVAPRFKLAPHEVPVPETDVDLKNWNFKKRPRAPFERLVKVASSPADEVGGWERRAFLRMLAGKPCFAIGGTRLITELAVKPGWFNTDEDVRIRAHKLVRERGWEPLLRMLKGGEHDTKSELSIMDQATVIEYLTALPPPCDRTTGAAGRKELQKRDGYTGKSRHKALRLRLRKAIEFICLLEAVIAHRVEAGTRLTHFARVSGLPDGVVRPEHVWDHLWIEPMIYVVNPRPRAADIRLIVENEIRTGSFRSKCGQEATILYRLLFGAPCTWSVCVAAAQACNRFYGTTRTRRSDLHRPKPTVAATVRPWEMEDRLKILDDRSYVVEQTEFSVPEEADDDYENLLIEGLIHADIAIKSAKKTVRRK